MLIISDGMRVPVAGDIDVASIPALRRHLERIINGGCSRVILDLEHVNYVDSSGVAMILTLGRQLRRSGGMLTLVNVSQPVARTFTILQLSSFIPMKARSGVTPPLVPLSRGAIPRWSLSLRISADSLSAARHRLEEMLVTLPLTSEEIFDVTLAAGEAMGNAVLHTPSGVGSMLVTAYDDRVIIETVDDGEGFEIAPDEEPVTTYEHGRGIKMMRLLVDAVDISKKRTGHGTVARLTKVFTPRNAAAPALAAEA